MNQFHLVISATFCPGPSGGRESNKNQKEGGDSVGPKQFFPLQKSTFPPLTSKKTTLHHTIKEKSFGRGCVCRVYNDIDHEGESGREGSRICGKERKEKVGDGERMYDLVNPKRIYCSYEAKLLHISTHLKDGGKISEESLGMK